MASPLVVLLMFGLLALPAIGQDARRGDQSPCSPYSSQHQEWSDRYGWSDDPMMDPEYDDSGYYGEFGYYDDEFGYWEQYGAYDDPGYYQDDYGYGPQDYGTYEYGYQDFGPHGDAFGESGWGRDEWAGGYDMDRGRYPRMDPDRFHSSRTSGGTVFDRRFHQDEPRWQDSRSFGSERPYVYQSTGYQFGRNIEAQVIGFERSRTQQDDVTLQVLTPDGERRQLSLGGPEYVRGNLPDVREGDIVVVQGNMVEVRGEPLFKAEQIITEDGSVFPLPGSSSPAAFQSPATFQDSRWTQRERQYTEQPLEYERPPVPSRTYAATDSYDSPRMTDEPAAVWYITDQNVRRDTSRRGERSQDDLDRGARFGYKNARNVEASWAKRTFTGTVVSLHRVDAHEFGGRAIVGQVHAEDGRAYDVVFGTPEQVDRRGIRAGSTVRISGTTRLHRDSPLFASNLKVLHDSGRSSWSSPEVARRDRSR